jgi:hypothetical protein
MKSRDNLRFIRFAQLINDRYYTAQDSYKLKMLTILLKRAK